MRILYPLLWSQPGRQACRAQTMNTVAALARHGHELILLMPQGRGDPALTADELRAYFRVEGEFRLVQRRSRWAGERLVQSLMWLRQIFADPEATHADLLYSRIPAMLGAGLLSPLPFAIDHYRPWPDELPAIRPLLRAAARRRNCAGFVIHSDYSAQAYRRAGIDEGLVLVAHNGADPPGELLGRPKARARLNLPEDRRIAVYAGRVNEEKGLDQILALARIRPHILFLLVGSEAEGPIERQAAACANVRTIGWAAPAELSAWLEAADVLLIPPSRAPLQRFRNCVLPMKLFAYLAAGRPILAPVSPDTAELLEHEGNALLVPPDDPDAAAGALDRLVGDPRLADRLGAAARRLSAELSWYKRAERISAFLERRLSEIGGMDREIRSADDGRLAPGAVVRSRVPAREAGAISSPGGGPHDCDAALTAQAAG